MKLIKSNIESISLIMKIIRDAQKYLATLNIDQWQDGYPNEDQIRKDIANDESFIIVNEFDQIIGTTVFTFREEPTYTKIYDGNWLTNEDAVYGVIHRLAVDNDFRGSGMANFVFDECEKMVKEHKEAFCLRVDTHQDNKGMQKLLTHRCYTYCGNIILESGAKRLAFEKVIK